MDLKGDKVRTLEVFGLELDPVRDVLREADLLLLLQIWGLRVN